MSADHKAPPSNDSVKLWPLAGKTGVPQTITADTPDLITVLPPDGANCIQLGSGAGNWQAFAATKYLGASVVLYQDRVYKDPTEMGLIESVKSIRKN